MGDFFGAIGHFFFLLFTQPIFNGLMLLYYLFNDFGLAIVVLTVLIKLLLFPLTLKQLKSMKANQQLQPQMQEVRKKYAKDPQAQAQAMQALYREYKINPLSGCLPMLVQLPVLYGLYYALYNVLHDVAKYRETLYAFLHPLFEGAPNVNLVWFQWLSFLNPIFGVDWSWTFPLSQPDPSHALPIIAALATFIQIRMSAPKPQPKDKAKSDQPDPSAQTMKIMQYLMPGMTLVFAWGFPSGLALYWTTSSIFQAVQQYFVTGWGALLTTPNLNLKGDSGASSSNGNKSGSEKSKGTGASSNGTSKKPDDESDSDGQPGAASSAIANKMHTTPRPGSGSSHRRGGSSASARRRGGARSRR